MTGHVGAPGSLVGNRRFLICRRKVRVLVSVVLEVFVVFAAAKLAGEVFVRLRLPAIAGELLVGVLLGPHLLGWIEPNSVLSALSQLGIVVLLFVAGLEMRVSDLMKVGRAASASSLAGIAAAAATGFAAAAAFGFSPKVSAVVALALSASSVGIAARAFADLGALRSRPARVVLGAAVLDDVIVLAALPLVLAAASGSGGGPDMGVWLGVVVAIVFIALVAFGGSKLVRRFRGLLDRPRMHRAPFILALGLCLGLAAAAEQLGLAALVGAFLAGMVLAETREQYQLEHRMEPLFDFLVPFFFVVSATRLDPASLTGAGAGLAVALVVVTVAAKLLGCTAGAVGIHGRERWSVGAGMVPRGEVTVAVATAALAAGAIPEKGYSALLAAVFATTLIAPLLMRAFTGAAALSRPALDLPPEASGLEDQQEGPPGR